MDRSLTKERGLALALMAGLAGLLLIAVGDFGIGLPPYPNVGSAESRTALEFSRASVLAELDPGRVPPLSAAPEQPSAFFTRHFVPAPKPAPPTTRKVTVSYMGHLQASSQQQVAYVQVDKDVVIGRVGTQVVADLKIANIGLGTLTLTNAAAEATLLEFGRPKTLEIPLK